MDFLGKQGIPSEVFHPITRMDGEVSELGDRLLTGRFVLVLEFGRAECLVPFLGTYSCQIVIRSISSSEISSLRRS
jgi:hypothetical protein